MKLTKLFLSIDKLFLFKFFKFRTIGLTGMAIDFGLHGVIQI